MISEIFDWSEVWAVAIPLVIIFLRRQQLSAGMAPVIVYLILAFILSAAIDVSWKYKPYMPPFLQQNNFLYNIVSICRLFCFIFFFRRIGIPKTKFYQNISLVSALLLLTFNFLFLEPFKEMGPISFAIEGIILLYFSLSYFLRELKKDEVNARFDPVLIIITGLSVFEAVCLPIFLFFGQLSKESDDSVYYVWPIHNAVNIVFCLFIARALYGELNYEYS